MAKTKRENVEDMLVAAFLVCPSIAEVSRQTGISRAAIYKALEKDSFREKLTRAKQEALQNAVSFLQGSLAECADTLMKVIRSNGTSQQTKVNACQIVMNQCKCWTDEIDVVSRIAALEAATERDK